jgi:hypothetical protein
MLRLKFTALVAAAVTAVAGLSSAPAHAVGPFLFAPWALGHLIGAAARVAALPLVVGAAAASAAYGAPAEGLAPYPAASGYSPGCYGPPAAYSPPAYYAPPATYYPPAYGPAYYGPAYYGSAYYGPAYYGSAAPYYAPGVVHSPMRRFYGWPRRYMASRMRYSGRYGAQVRYGAGGFYRRR